jgi:hypothetical protein
MEKKTLRFLYFTLVWFVLAGLFAGFFIWNIPYHERLHVQNAIYGGCIEANTSVGMRTDIHCDETVSDGMRQEMYRADTSLELANYIIWTCYALIYILVYFWVFIANHKDKE